MLCGKHRVDRVRFTIRLNWIGTPHPLTRRLVCTPPFGSGGGGLTRLRERGWGSPNSDEETDTVEL